MQTSFLKLGILLPFVLGPILLSAQHYNFPLNRYSKYFLLHNDSLHYGSMQGKTESSYNVGQFKGLENKERYSKSSQKLYDQHLIELDEKDFKVHADLLLNFELGTELWEDNNYTDTTRMSRNTRGFILQADIGDKVSISTSFLESQSSVPWYLYNYGIDRKVMPGSGRIKPFNGTGFDHNIAQGYVSYSPSSRVNIQFGTQKNFIGSGYRSLLLSDHAYSYPQLKSTFSFAKNKIRYHVIHAWLQTLKRLPHGDTPESLFIRKNGSFKYLEFQPIKELTIGIFESVMWNRFDPQEGTLSPNAWMYSPIIGTSAAALGLDDRFDNVSLGVDLSARPFKELMIYGQYLLDQESRDGYQIGLRTIGLGIEGLSLRAEYNSVAPFTYSDLPVRQGYNHFGEALAHPMGAGFDEVSLGLMYFYHRWFADIAYTMADQLTDRADIEGVTCNTGGNLFNNAECTITEGLDDYTAHLEQLDIRLGYFFNPKSNFNAYLSWRYRDRQGAGIDEGHSLIGFGIEMSLFDKYEDF